MSAGALLAVEEGGGLGAVCLGCSLPLSHVSAIHSAVQAIKRNFTIAICSRCVCSASFCLSWSEPLDL